MNISILLSEYVVSFLIIHEWAAMVNNGSGNNWLLDGTSPYTKSNVDIPKMRFFLLLKWKMHMVHWDDSLFILT